MINKELNPALKKIKPQIVRILRKYGVVRAGVFGSYARGEQNAKSDIDLLIKIRPHLKFSLLDLVGAEQELEKTLKKKVDLLTYKGINPNLKERILREEVRII